MTSIKGSSTVKGVTYEPRTKVLTVAFHSGGTYDYANVSKHQHEQLMTAKSRGEWVHQHLVSKEKMHPATKHSEVKPLLIKKPVRHVLGMGKKP